MYTKLMRISDDLMWSYWELLTDAPILNIRAMQQRVRSSLEHPMHIKKLLAQQIVSDFHTAEIAKMAAEEWESRVQRKEAPSTIERVEVRYADVAPAGGRDAVGRSPIRLDKLLVKTGLAESGRDAQRKINQRAVRVEGEVFPPTGVAIIALIFPFEVLLQVGHHFKRAVVVR
jgi:tyrosyl-tRNA synthetase